MMPVEEEGRGSETPLLDGEKFAIGGTGASMNWLGRPADERHDLGGWFCASGVIGAYFLVFAAYFGVMSNLVLYLVNELDESNAAAASTVNNLFGTSLFCAFLGGIISDGYTGRLWGSVIFETLSLFSFLSISLIGMLVVYGQSSLLLGSLYGMMVASGSSFPTLTSLGADQLRLPHEKAKYFTWAAMSVSAGQTFATTVITYLDGREQWVLGFWLCTAAAGAALLCTLCIARNCRIYRAGGNALVRVGQVLVCAIGNRNVRIPKDLRLLYEVEGEMSAIPGCRKLFHTNSLRCLDKAAVRNVEDVSAGPWKLCTVTQVEEVKCLLRVMPVGLATTCLGTALAQVTTFFEEQAAVTNGKLSGALNIAPASMQLFYIAGALLTGFLYNTVGVCPLIKRWSWYKNHGATSLQLQGIALLVGIVAMVVAAIVEAYRLHVANVSGSLISVTWLIPQNFLLGISTNFLYAGRYEFFYNEVSDGMRTTGLSMGFLFSGASNYLTSMFVILVTTITTRSGGSGWIPDDLDDGHLDYFYWFLASFLTLSFVLYLLYARFYTYRETADGRKLGPNSDAFSID